MKVESLEELKAAVDEWRRGKRHAREAIPHELFARARRAIRIHGLGRVAQATKFDRGRLSGKGGEVEPVAMPAFSRLEISIPAVSNQPIAEIETATGLKLRFFVQTRETLSLLSAACGIGAAP